MANPYKQPGFRASRGAFGSAMQESAEAAGTQAHQFQLARGGLFASIKEMGVNMWNSTVGSVFKGAHVNVAANAEKVADGLVRQQHNPKLGKEVLKANLGNKGAHMSAINGAKKAHIVERVISKPFRVAARHPRLALIGAALFGAKYMSDRHNREQRLETLDNYAAQNPMQMQPAGGCYNSVSPEEYAMMQGQMRQPGMQQGGFADREMARRAEMEALAAGQQGPAA